MQRYCFVCDHIHGCLVATPVKTRRGWIARQRLGLDKMRALIDLYSTLRATSSYTGMNLSYICSRNLDILPHPYIAKHSSNKHYNSQTIG